jgi:cobalt-zinc-cadmium efflux system outer membrane protein
MQPIAFEPLPTPLTAVEKSPLSLAELEELARQNNPTLGVARANIAAARGRQVQGGLYPNPTIGYVGMEIGEDDTAGQQGGFVAQTFITGNKLGLNRAVAGQEVAERQFQLTAQEQRVLNDVRLRFYDTLYAQRQVELTGELLRTREQAVGLSQRLLEAQQVSQSDLIQAEIEAEVSRIQSDNAANDRLEAWRRLAAVVGISADEPRPLAGNLEDDIPIYEWEEAHSSVLAQNPELAAAEARAGRARLAIQRARRENVPDIDVFVSATHMNQSNDDVAGVQVGMPIPILNRNQGNIMQAEAELVAAANNVRRIELDLQNRLAIIFRRYANARQQTDRYRNEILPRSQRSIDLVTRGYEAGEVDYLMLLTSQQTYVRVNLAYIAALAELRRAATLIEGKLLEDSLLVEGMSATTAQPEPASGGM